MKAAILTVGTEILFGQIVNTNASYLSEKLNLMGFDVMYHYTVGDNPGRVREMMELAFRDCDLVLTTGGLGPTQDDLTKEIACEVMGDELVMREDILQEIRDFFERSGSRMTDNNIKQAELPSRAEIFHNGNGTAPGFGLEKDGKFIVCMPGPPREVRRMFENDVVPYLKKFRDDVMYYRMLRFFGIGESSLETEIMDLVDGQTDPTLATYAKQCECMLRIASKRPTEEEARAAVEKVEKAVVERVGRYMYSEDDEELAEAVCRKLIERNITLSSAESCTGGMFAAAVTDVPGISQCFQRGLVTYSNEAKMDELGVRKETLEEHGAVSEETAIEMVEGLRKVTGSDICISVTGIAGPGGGTPEKPVGLVYVGFSYRGETFAKKLQVGNFNRQGIRSYTVLYMFDLINRYL